MQKQGKSLDDKVLFRKYKGKHQENMGKHQENMEKHRENNKNIGKH